MSSRHRDDPADAALDPVGLQPFLGVGEILVAWVLGEFGFEVGDDPSEVALGAPVVA
jgi:hypothetical protein